MKHKKALRIILLIIIILTVTVIWGHSCMTRAKSTEESSFVKEIIDTVVQTVSGNQSFAIPEVVIRKSAHFFEYAVLGIELVIFIALNKSVYLNDDKKRGLIKLLCLYPTAFAISLFVASVDEIIQYFTGRYSSIWDVMLDMTGASFSILIFLLIKSLIQRKK